LGKSGSAQVIGTNLTPHFFYFLRSPHIVLSTYQLQSISRCSSIFSLSPLLLHTYLSPASSNHIPKIDISLQYLLPAICLPILPPEIHTVHNHTYRNQDITPQHTINPGAIRRAILAPKDQTPRDAADTAKPDHRRATERPLPVAANVVRLISHACRNELERDSTHLTFSLCQSDRLAITLVVCLVTCPMTSGCRLPCKRRSTATGYLATPGLRSIALNYHRICISIPSFYWL
jgi:hypothetical protein